MDIGTAIEAAKHGHRISRDGWNGKDQFVYYVPAGRYSPSTETGHMIATNQDDGLVPYHPYLAIWTGQGVATWAPSGSDALANDWRVHDL